MFMQRMAFFYGVIARWIGKRMKDEKGEVNVVAIVVLIGIAIVLAIIFKDQISQLLKTLIGAITTKASKAID